jgi:conserved repeat domain
MILKMITLLEKLLKYKYLIGCFFLSSFLLVGSISIWAENATDASSENSENPYSIVVIKDYFEVLGVFLDIGIILLLWKTVKDFAELAKVSKLQTEVRFRPWVGPNGGFELLREDSQKKQYSITMKNFGEVPASNVIVTCTITDSMPDKLSILNLNNYTESKNHFQIGPLLPGMEKRYWVFIENEKYRSVMEGTSDIFIFIYFMYLFSGGKSGYGMISQLDSKTNNFVHKEMWID